MLCCSLIAILLGQGGALVTKWRLLGGGVFAAVFAVELALAAFALPRLYAIDVPHRIADWPICATLLGR